jgi:zinc transporter 2
MDKKTSFLSADFSSPQTAVSVDKGEDEMKAKKAVARRKIYTIMIICFIFMACEVAGGLLAGSLAILTDAAHLLSDATSFGISLFALYLADRPRTPQATYGFHRIEIFGAMASVLLIWLLTAGLCWEAVNRILHPEQINGEIMFITALGGICVNLLMMRTLHGDGTDGHHGHSHGGAGHGHSHGGGGGGSDKNYSVQAAYIHILGDFVQSIGVLIASIMIWANPDLHLADPICTFIFSILVLSTTTNILYTAYNTLLNGSPEHIAIPKLASDLMALPSVTNVHDLHIWSFGQDRIALTAHIIVRGNDVKRTETLKAASEIAEKYAVKHSTFQIESDSSEEHNVCLKYNEHVDECAIAMQDPESRSVSLFYIERPGGSIKAKSDRMLLKESSSSSSEAGDCDHHGHSHDHHGHAHH